MSSHYAYLAWDLLGGPFRVWSPPVECHQLKLSKVVSEEQNIQNELVALHMQDGRQQEDTSVWLVIPKIRSLRVNKPLAVPAVSDANAILVSAVLACSQVCHAGSHPSCWRRYHRLCNHPSRGKGNNLLL